MSPIRGVSIDALGFSPDGSRLAADDAIGDLWIWNVGGGSVVRTIQSDGELCGSPEADGTRIAAGDCGTHFSPSYGRCDATGRLIFQTRRRSARS